MEWLGECQAVSNCRGLFCPVGRFSGGVAVGLAQPVLPRLGLAHAGSITEDRPWNSPLAHNLVEQRFWNDRDGMVAVPQGPGFGITLNDDVERYRVA